MEERNVNKLSYKIFLLILKVIPMCIAFIFFINTILSYFDIYPKILNYIGSIGLLPLLFLYFSSYVLRFCEYHRIFLHYVVIINCINIYDCYFGIPVDDFSMLMIYSIISAIGLFLVLYFKKIKK